MQEKIASIICEVCNSEMKNWQLSPDNVLFLCPNCFHIVRDLELCNANAREHAWGGNAIFDKIRNYLTYKKLISIVKSKNKTKQNILEIGFGYGDILSHFYKEGHKINGVDLATLDVNVNEIVKNNGNLIFGKVEEVQFKDEDFDIIYAIHLVEHLEDAAAVFRKCYNALKKDGILFFITPNANSKGLKIFKDAWWNLEDPTHLKFFSEKSISMMLSNAGFKNIEISIPIWDSVTVEINSLIRKFKKDAKKYGALNSFLVNIINIALLPFSMTIRIFYPKISSSLIVKVKK